jgi:hypothetical protein
MVLKKIKNLILNNVNIKKKYNSIKYIFLQFPFIKPKGIIFDTNEWIINQSKKNSWYYKRKSNWYKPILNSEIIVYPSPNHYRKEIHSAFSQNRIVKTLPANLYYLNSAFVFSSDGIVISKSNYVFDDFAHNFNISTLKKSKLFKPFFSFSSSIKIFDKNIAVLASPQGHNHYHWLMDVIPRIYLLDQVLQAISYFIVPFEISQMQIETLEIFGIKSYQLIKLKQREKIFCNNLYVPSLPGSEGHTPKWAFDFLKKSFFKKPTIQKESNRKIYFSRKDANQRNIVNEDEIIIYLISVGFEIIEMSKLPFSTQLEICASASIIISLHGAALANIFVASNCKVLEIFSPDYFRTDCYYTLANLAGLQYWYLEGVNQHNDVKLDWGDIYLDKQALQETLSAMGNYAS